MLLAPALSLRKVSVIMAPAWNFLQPASTLPLFALPLRIALSLRDMASSPILASDLEAVTSTTTE
jgi:hypothetical protein